eukprot:SAG22_NODE_11020_length_505_cov_0.394089_1_plen_55_part_10
MFVQQSRPLACKDFVINYTIHLTIMRPTQRTYVHVGRERFQRFSYNSPDRSHQLV